MIQEIKPHTYDPVYRPRKPKKGDFALYYQENQILLKKQEKEYSFPVFGDLHQEMDVWETAYYLFSIDGTAYYLTEKPGRLNQSSYVMKELSVFRSFQPMYQAFAGITGSQIFRWRQSRKFCGFCGSRMEPDKRERAMVCPLCGQREYPKISPAVIVAVTHGDKLLMTRYAKGAYQKYALVAGFVEVGETLEECVRREVMEEVGLKIKHIRYYKSQPWAFSDTVMVGFTAELDGDDTICLEQEELAEAGWFSRQEVEEYSPFLSVGQEMMKAFKEGHL